MRVARKLNNIIKLISLIIGIFFLILGIKIQTVKEFFFYENNHLSIRVFENFREDSSNFKHFDWVYNSKTNLDKKLNLNTLLKISRSWTGSEIERTDVEFPQGILIESPFFRDDEIEIEDITCKIGVSSAIYNRDNERNAWVYDKSESHTISNLPFKVIRIEKKPNELIDKIGDNNPLNGLFESYLILFTKPNKIKSLIEEFKKYDTFWITTEIRLKKESKLKPSSTKQGGIVKLVHATDIEEYCYNGIDTLNYLNGTNGKSVVLKNKKRINQGIQIDSELKWNFKSEVINPSNRIGATSSRFPHPVSQTLKHEEFDIKYKNKDWLFFLITLFCIPLITYGLSDFSKKIKKMMKH